LTPSVLFAAVQPRVPSLATTFEHEHREAQSENNTSRGESDYPFHLLLISSQIDVGVDAIQFAQKISQFKQLLNTMSVRPSWTAWPCVESRYLATRNEKPDLAHSNGALRRTAAKVFFETLVWKQRGYPKDFDFRFKKALELPLRSRYL